MTVLILRVELGEGKLIGETVHSYQEASAVKSRGVCDYVGLGPFRKRQQKGTDSFS